MVLAVHYGTGPLYLSLIHAYGWRMNLRPSPGGDPLGSCPFPFGGSSGNPLWLFKYARGYIMPPICGAQGSSPPSYVSHFGAIAIVAHSVVVTGWMIPWSTVNKEDDNNCS